MMMYQRKKLIELLEIKKEELQSDLKKNDYITNPTVKESKLYQINAINYLLDQNDVQNDHTKINSMIKDKTPIKMIICSNKEQEESIIVDGVIVEKIEPYQEIDNSLWFNVYEVNGKFCRINSSIVNSIVYDEKKIS